MILSNVCKNYGQNAVLRDLSCTFEEGKITAVLGGSGAGKTTLLRILAGLTSYEGTVDGAEGARPVRRKDRSFLFQESMLLPNLTAEENCKFVLEKKDWGKVREMLSRVGLEGKENAYPRELSGGECRRVAIARAFCFPHKVLLMDEPFSSLDLALKRSLIELVCRLWQEKQSTVIFVTHDVREAVLLSHRAVVLKNGNLSCDTAISAPFPRNFLDPPAEERILTAALLER